MKKVLIIRMSAIGDIVMASPIVDTIKLTYPDAEISWLVQPHFSAPIINHPNIDHVIHWDHKEWSKLWKQKKFRKLFKTVRAFKKQLREYQFDTVLDLQGLLKSGIPAWFTGASNRVGLGSKETAIPAIPESVKPPLAVIVLAVPATFCILKLIV